MKRSERHFGLDGDFRREPKTSFFCSICQRDLDPNNKGVEYVYLGDPCDHVVHPDFLEGGEIKAPIGPECKKRVPAQYRITSKCNNK